MAQAALHLSVSVDDSSTREIAGAKGKKAVDVGAVSGLHKCIALVERHHKRREFIRGSKELKDADGRLLTAATDPHRLTMRSGALSRSYTRRIVERELAAYYGSDLEYARVHEYGGTTRPHDIFPRHGKALAFMVNGQSVVVKSVRHPGSKIPARPGLLNTINATANDVEKIMAGAVMERL